MTVVDLARLQFASTSVYHILFVPRTIGLALITAMLQTRWHRTGEQEYLRLTRLLRHPARVEVATRPVAHFASLLLMFVPARLIARAWAVVAPANGHRVDGEGLQRHG